MADVVEGWVFAHYMRKAHYQRNGRTLCGKYGAFPAAALEPDTGVVGPDDCAACRRKLDASPAATKTGRS